MKNLPWTVSPDELGVLDASIVRYIAGVLTDDFMERMLGADNFGVRRRLSALMQKHSPLTSGDLVMMSGERRHRLAEDIIASELAERCTPKSFAVVMPTPHLPMTSAGASSRRSASGRYRSNSESSSTG